nr:lytic transglycosylase domain-containing protein [Myxococcota bacterium]
QGLMQLMPATARELGVSCPFDPRENVLGGTRYLRWMRDRMGSWPRALAAYNAGPARIESGHWPAETRRYVARVMRRWRPGDVGLEVQ